jgi:hypothetical protein
MRALIIGEKEREAIREAIERARKKPLLLADVKRLAIADDNAERVTLADRRPEHDRPRSQHVLIPIGFHLAISFEQQPPGICLHLSLSVAQAERERVPNPHAIDMVFTECLRICGHADLPPDDGRTWVEEFAIDGKPGGLAVNGLFLVEPTTTGHA